MTQPGLTDDELKRYHAAIVQQLFDFDDLCRANDIEYMLAFGSLLGAVRHKGLIPWDDDVDIMMMESEFEKLLKVELPDFLEIDRTRITKLNDKRYHYARAPHLEMWKPIFIDIFVMKETGSLAELLTKILLWVDDRKKLPQRNPLRISKSILKYPIKPIRHLLRYLADRQQNKTRIRYCHHLYQDFSFSKDVLFPIRRDYVFNKKHLSGPYNPIPYLLTHYGKSYLTPTPPNQRRFRIHRIDF